MNDIPVDRRTALKMTGAGLVGSTIFSSHAIANSGFDAAVILLDAFFEEIGPEAFRNVTEDGSGNSLEIHGAALFGKKPGSDALGGGRFSVNGGTIKRWTANEVVRFEKYGAFPSSVAAPWIKEWKGGLVELEVDFPHGRPAGVSDSDTLIVECFIGTNDSDSPENDSQGVLLGPYDQVEKFGTVFNY